MNEQAILPFVVELDPNSDGVTGRAGLALVAETMRALGLSQMIRGEIKVRQRSRGYTEAAQVEAVVLLLASGGECLDDLEVLRKDAGLCRLLGTTLPSPDATRHFLYTFHDETLMAAARAERGPEQKAYIPRENAALRGLARVQASLVRRVAAQGKSRKATLDHDATILESHKREAMAHYQGGRGYQPAAIYWAEEDLVVADEYRDGNVPAAMSNLPLIRRGFAALPSNITEYYFRADSACYDATVLKWLVDPARPDGPAGPIGFTISADMTQDLRTVCQAAPGSAWKLLEERVDETVHWCEVEFAPGDWSKQAWPLRYLVRRIRKHQGVLFANGGDTKYLAITTNREGPGAELIRWHYEKAGTIELVHDVTKNELGAAVPPCGRFGANAAWYRLSLITYNVISAMKSLALPVEFHTARPKRLRFLVLTLAGRIVSHAGRLVLRIALEADRRAGFREARRRLAACLARPAPA